MSSNHRDNADFNDQPQLCKCAQYGQIKRPFITMADAVVCSIDCYEKRTGKSWRSYFEPLQEIHAKTLTEIRKVFA